jgi:hypothetical protein
MAFRLPLLARAVGIALLTAAAFAADSGEGKRPPTPVKELPPIFEPTEEDRIEAAVRAAERRELVRPAPAGFKPGRERRKFRLILVARDKTIRAGEPFWYRLELQNLGRETVHYWETPSFLKDGGNYDLGRWDFYAIDPKGQRETMVIGSLFGGHDIRETHTDAIPIPGSERMSEVEIEQYMRRDSAKRRADRDLIVDLAPGETIISRPWRWVDAEERVERRQRGEANLAPRPTGNFRELWTNFRFDFPGRYAVRAVYDDTMSPMPSEDFIKGMEKDGYSRASTIADYKKQALKRLGRIESLPVAIEVLP